MKKLFFILLMSFMTLTSNAQIMKLGDLNHDNQVTVTDVMTLVNNVLHGKTPIFVSFSNVTMNVGSTVTIPSGNGSYDVQSSNVNVASATVKGSTIIFVAVGHGTSTITVTDRHSGQTATIEVTVAYQPLTLSSSSLGLFVGDEGSVEITSGSGSYSVESSDGNVVSAEIDGNTVSIFAFGGGSATITVTDTESGQTATVTVTVNYLPLTLSASSLTLSVGEVGSASITSGNGSFSVRSSDTSVATAVVEGSSIQVTAVGSGTANITVTDRRSGETAIIEVTVTAPISLCPNDHHPHLIDLDLPSGTKWACCNVDTDHPENQSPTNYGGYYAWGETETKSTYNWSTYSHCDGSESTCHYLGSNIAGTEYDVAHVKWGGSWVMPTKEQRDELINNCTYEWTTVNGVNGGKFTSKTNGGSIFVPAAGFSGSSDVSFAGSDGSFWSSTQHPLEAYGAYILDFDSGGTSTGYGFRNCGFPVRPVVRN